MTFIKAAVLVPALASGLWFLKGAPSAPIPIASAQTQFPTQSLAPPPAPAAQSVAPAAQAQMQELEVQRVRAQKVAAEGAALNRRLRVERILVTLDRIAEVATQMNPDQAAALEPVIVELAERTIDLTSEEAVQSASTDDELTDIERTVDRLVVVLENMVEPEMSL